jgi:hypothetical protein
VTIRRTKRKPTRTGKVFGTVRYGKKDMEITRKQVYERAEGKCQLREILLRKISEEIDIPEWQRNVKEFRIKADCWIDVRESEGHDVHLKAKRRNGDALDNRVWGCPYCHAASHNYFGKPCPPKPVGISGKECEEA